MIYSKKPLAQHITQICKANDIKHVVISPGSRNAPLIIGFTNQPFFNCYSVVDERSAAFFALGIAQQTKKPVVIICTSGSALLNFYPAVAEAFYSKIPLIVISADRPEHLINIGDGQTIFQKHAFGSHILFEANLKSLANSNFFGKIFSKNKSQNLIQKAIKIAKINMGPVHINTPFDEPLYKTVSTQDTIKLSPVKDKKLRSPKIISSKLKIWNNSKKKMILVGVNYPNVLDNDVLENLANDPSIIVFTETTSNLHHPNFFPFIDQLITPLEDSEYENLKPDILITFGGMIISKRIKLFLRNYKPKQHWHIDPLHANDTFFCLTNHFKTSPNLFLGKLLKLQRSCKSNYFDFWHNVNLKRYKNHINYLKSCPFCDFKAFELISLYVPNNFMVHSSNSAVIRYLQLFQFDSSIKLYCNRGTSGIDGSTSTAVGASIVSNLPTLLITGDLSFFYDINGLWNNYIPKNFKIIIINNGGGGIFRIINNNNTNENFKTFFETKHNRNAKSLSSDFGFSYLSADSSSKLEKQLKIFFEISNTPAILEIFTPYDVNDKVLLDYFKSFK